MELKQMSPLELIESLQKYPAEEFPEEHSKIKDEIELRKRELHQKEASGGTALSTGEQFLASWKRKKLISTVITVALSLMFGWQLVSGMREPSQAIAILGVILVSYAYSILRVELFLRNEQVITKMKTGGTDREVKEIIKSTWWQKLLLLIAYLGLGAIYVLL